MSDFNSKLLEIRDKLADHYKHLLDSGEVQASELAQINAFLKLYPPEDPPGVASGELKGQLQQYAHKSIPFKKPA